MIASLSGKVKDKSAASIIIDVGGVGYEVFCTEKLIASSRQGQNIEIYTRSYLRENAAELYGFAELAERAMFDVLLGVSGVGPKAALTILNAAPLAMLQKAIATQDTSVLTKVSGIGTKRAEKIIVELKDTFGEIWGALPGNISAEGEVMEALESIGYSRAQIQKILRELPQDIETAEGKIKEALKMLGK